MRVKNISILIQPKLHVVSLDFQKFFVCVAFLLLTTFVPIIGNSSQRKEVYQVHFLSLRFFTLFLLPISTYSKQYETNAKQHAKQNLEYQPYILHKKKKKKHETTDCKVKGIVTRTAFRYSPSGFVSLISYQFLKSPFYPFLFCACKDKYYFANLQAF